MDDISINGRSFRVVATDASDRAFWRGVAEGAWEIETFRSIGALYPSADTFVDIGAWIGPMTLLAASAGLTVIAVEPDPVCAAKLRANIDANGFDVTVIERALDSRAGSLALHPGPNGFGDSMTSAAGRNGARDTSRAAEGIDAPIQVQTVTLDEMRQRIAPGARCIVKVDIEGHEYGIADQIAELSQLGTVGFDLSLHPRALYNRDVETVGKFAARLAAYRQTVDLMRRLRRGRMTFDGKSRSAAVEAARRIGLGLSGPKNFSVFVA